MSRKGLGVAVRVGLLGAALVMGSSVLAVSPPEGPFQAPWVAIWWRWSLVRLWVAISNRLSVIVLIVVGAVRPLRLVLGLAAG
jgi:hypothetical protein